MLARNLATLGALGMIAVGTTGIVAPDAAARGYGIQPNDDGAIAYVRAAAARDVAIGAVLLRSAISGGRKGLRATLACAALIPLADLAIVAAKGGDPRRLLLHAAGLAGIATVWALATVGES